ncbi:hypothetical protein AK812_SmicGene32607 [Symbiodinium microadriaticum]|uniref:Uncharacterized protein n=1 Tax=Symbiodinium microadriaticum TaxID=2951 RepID=A0A1Q9CTM8_SYMMI|nr:hypothetical protein AK812_SmicGene32607 [Symbiodinium microadriaticum]
MDIASAATGRLAGPGQAAPDLRRLLKRRVPIPDHLAVADSRCLFCASRQLRAVLSSFVCIRLKFEVPEPLARAGTAAVVQRRVQRARIRVLQAPVSGPLPIYCRCPLRETPLEKVSLFRLLLKLAPMIKWDECEQIQCVCHTANLDFLELPLRTCTTKLHGCMPWVLLERAEQLSDVVAIEMKLQQICGFPPGLTLPKVTRVKVFCWEPAAALSENAFCEIYRLFPNLERLHLDMLPSLLPPLCLSKFVALPDFRISFHEVPGTAHGEGVEGSYFLAANLLTMPFAGEGGIFQRLVRLQMDALAGLSGGALLHMATALRGAPALRRLGTISAPMLRLLDPASEAFQLEEVVIAMGLEDSLGLFTFMLPLTQLEKRCSIRRLGIHLQAPDALIKPPEEVENFLCAGFYSLAKDCLAPDAFLNFSQSQEQLVETVIFQLPYLDEHFFSLDMANYGPDKVAGTSPLDQPMRKTEALAELRPMGTLISGPLDGVSDVAFRILEESVWFMALLVVDMPRVPFKFQPHGPHPQFLLPAS